MQQAASAATALNVLYGNGDAYHGQESQSQEVQLPEGRSAQDAGHVVRKLGRVSRQARRDPDRGQGRARRSSRRRPEEGAIPRRRHQGRKRSVDHQSVRRRGAHGVARHHPQRRSSLLGHPRQCDARHPQHGSRAGRRHHLDSEDQGRLQLIRLRRHRRTEVACRFACTLF